MGWLRNEAGDPRGFLLHPSAGVAPGDHPIRDANKTAAFITSALQRILAKLHIADIAVTATEKSCE